MTLQSFNCPSCGAKVSFDIEKGKFFFCSFCGTQIYADDGEQRFTKTYNFNFTDNYSDDLDEPRRRRKDETEDVSEKKDNSIKPLIVLFLIAIGLMIIGCMSGYLIEAKEKKDGKIKVGLSSKEIKGEKYTSVIEQLEAAGFTNIKTVDLNDAGLLWNSSE